MYVQVKESIINLIKEGEFKDGDKIPTEEELQQKYQVSRATIRRALDDIEREGIIFRRQGAGTFVRHKLIKPDLLKLTGFSQIMKARGIIPSYKTLKVEIIIAPLKVKELLNDYEISKVLFVKRLCLGDNQVIALHEIYLHPSLQFSLKELTEMKSFYALMSQKHNLTPAYADETIGASVADKELAQLLEIKKGDPLLDIWRVTYAKNNQIIEIVHIIYIASRFEYQLRLHSS